MHLEEIREYALSLPGATEDVKWGSDLCFLVGNKMFLVGGLDGPFHVSFKVSDDDFEELTATAGIIPAPYMARHKWVSISDPERFSATEWKRRISEAYELIKNKLPRKLRDSIG